ncbi:MAG: hypothetical protein HYX96_04855, partial [Chloroflexi bacterium]|nr:hypothetical protein [Chloroflexota bacterium]
MAVEEPVSPHNKFVARLNFVKPSIPAETTTLTSGTVFALSGSNGDILAHSHHGFYAHDTRFLSVFQVRLDGRPLLNTGSAVFNDRLASFYCNTGGISLVRDRYVSDHLHEDIYLVNNAPAARKVRLELTFAADFADIFEVRRGQFQKVGDVRIEPREGQDIALVYRRGDFIRETWINFSAEPRIKGSTAVIEVALEPKVTWQTCLDISPVADGKNGQGPCVVSIQSPPFYARKREKVMVGVFEQVPVDAPLETVPELSTDNLELCQAYYRAVSDLRSLRLKQDDHYLLAAGLPWFMAIFGRDAIISALQTKLLGPELMLGTLRTLADLQANASDPFREAQPGKILHEARRGELSLFEHVPH